MTEKRESVSGRPKKKLLAEGRNGFTGTPGQGYRVVEARIWLLQSGEFRVDLTEVQGGNEGHLVEHSRKEISGYGATIAGAIERARADASEVGMTRDYVVQAISAARVKMDE